MMNNMYGQSGFYWFLGSVEDRNDPQFLGRCRLRIAGYHTQDKTILPTEDLPWALPILPINSRNTFSAPLIGDWVVGFFMDGLAGQFPVILGVLPAFSSPTTE